MENDNSNLNPPSLFTMLKTFTKEFSKYAKSGMSNVTLSDYADRLDACNSCPHFKKDTVRCGLCGCYMEHKAKWKTAECPDNPPRWRKQALTRKEKEDQRIDKETTRQLKNYYDGQKQKGNSTDSSNEV